MHDQCPNSAQLGSERPKGDKVNHAGYSGWVNVFVVSVSNARQVYLMIRTSLLLDSWHRGPVL